MADDTANPFSEKILSLVEGHYQQTRTPLFLASLGKDVQLPPGTSLRAFITTHLADKLTVVDDPNIKQRAAVAWKDEATAVLVALGHPSNRLLRFPRTLFGAFCKTIPADHKIFYSRRGKPHFRVAIESPGDHYVEVEADLRTQGVDARDPQSLAEEDRARLLRQIETWAKRHGISLTDLELPPTPTQEDSEVTALDRFLAVQRAEVVSQILIPGDIAQMLRRSK